MNNHKCYLPLSLNVSCNLRTFLGGVGVDKEEDLSLRFFIGPENLNNQLNFNPSYFYVTCAHLLQ
jgi:hypothetical protein